MEANEQEQEQFHPQTPGAWEEPDPDSIPNLQNRGYREADLEFLEETYVHPDDVRDNVPTLQRLAYDALEQQHLELTQEEDKIYDDNWPSNQLTKGEYKEEMYTPAEEQFLSDEEEPYDVDEESPSLESVD